MAMTVIDYNGVRLHNVQIVSVNQHVEYDSTQTDQLFVRTTLTARGVVFYGPINQYSDATRPNVYYLPTDAPIDDPNLVRRPQMAERSPREIVAYLSEPRHTLRVMMIGANGVERVLWEVLPAQEGRNHTVKTDVANGPRPIAVNLLNIAKWGFEIEFQIEFAQQLRDERGLHDDRHPTHWAMNNRWRVREALDQNFFMTKTYEGTIRITQANPEYQFVARWLAFPQLEPGFRRDSCEYAVSADGLEVQYMIVDRQEAHAPPWPCTKMEVSHSETLSKFGYYVQSACQVRLWGPPGVPKALLLARLAQILRNRLLWDGQFGKSAFLESLRIVDTIGEENSVFGEMIVNRFPSAAVNADDNADAGVIDPGVKAGLIGAGIGAILGPIGAAAGALIARQIVGGKPDKPADNAKNAPPPNDWFEKLTRGVLGTDLELPPLQLPQGAPAVAGLLGAAQTAITYGPAFQNYWQHMRPLPTGYSVDGTVRAPAVSIFFACYYQVPEHMPHEFHPGQPGQGQRQPQANDGAQPPADSRHEAQAAVAPPAVPKEVTRIEGGTGGADSPDMTAAAHAAALYTHATLMNDYDFDRGRAVFVRSITGQYGDPMSYDDGQDDVEIVTVSRPLLIRRVSYEAERIGTWPEIPVPADYDIPGGGRAKLLRCRIQPLAPTLAPDGIRLLYRVEAQYEWAITRAFSAADLDVATLPHVRSDAVHPFVLGANASVSLLLGHGRTPTLYNEDAAI
jgi:hypothetical protein